MMELWVRSQNKEELKKCEQLYYYFRNGHHYITRYYDEDIIGSYKTKERCLEILDEIQRTIAKVLVNKNNELSGKYNLEVIDSAIYEMPKE